MPGTTAIETKMQPAGGVRLSMLDHLSYYSRYAWVGLKSCLGISISADNRHLCDRIVRGARAGKIAPATVLAVEIRRDGFGSQVLSRLSVEAAARDIGLGYAHRPFEAIAHGEGNPGEWVKRCEETFALGEERPRLADFDLPIVDLTRYASDRGLWPHPHIVLIGNMYVHCDRNPAIYREVVPLPAMDDTKMKGPLKIAAHIRRGDVSTHRVAHRFTSNEVVVSTLRRIIAEVEKSGRAYEATVYSIGAPDAFTVFEDLGCRIDVTSSAPDVFGHLRSADILLTAKSTFSYIAALYSTGIVLYEPFARRPMPSWIPRDKDGGFSADRLAGLL